MCFVLNETDEVNNFVGIETSKKGLYTIKITEDYMTPEFIVKIRKNLLDIRENDINKQGFSFSYIIKSSDSWYKTLTRYMHVRPFGSNRYIRKCALLFRRRILKTLERYNVKEDIFEYYMSYYYGETPYKKEKKKESKIFNNNKKSFFRKIYDIIPKNPNYALWDNIEMVTKDYFILTRDIWNGLETIEINIVVERIDAIRVSDLILYKNKITIKSIRTSLNLFVFMDEYISDSKGNISSFKRKYKNILWYIENNRVVYMTRKIRTYLITNRDKDPEPLRNFITMNIATQMRNDVMIPIAVSWKSHFDSKVFFINDYNNSDNMFNICFKNLFIKEYDRATIYIHNGSNFDWILLLSPLIQFVGFENIKIKSNNNKITCIIVKYKNMIYYFHDSYQLLPMTLDKLAVEFNISKSKTRYTHELMNKQFLDNKKLNKYNDINNNNNDYIFKNNLLEYLENDLLILWEIIDKVSILNYNRYSINISNCPTISSLTTRIFSTNFNKIKDKSKKFHRIGISRIVGKYYNIFKRFMRGGRAEVFKPIIENGIILDVNSMYPFMMNEDLPIGSPTYFKGYYDWSNPDILSFCHALVESPIKAKIGILPMKYKDKIIYPLGKFKGWFTSEELKLAQENKWKVKVYKGYYFLKGKIFTELIEHLYELKKNNDIFAKLLMNSTFGRLAMSIHRTSVKLIEMNKFDYYKKNYNIRMARELNINNNIYYWIEILNTYNYLNINIAVAAMITSLARCHLFNLIKSYDTYYCDTDSIVIKDNINIKNIGKNLGQLKILYKIKKGIFISPKLYYIDTGENIIIKAKGLSQENLNLSEKDFEQLLIESGNIKLKQSRWDRSSKIGIKIKKFEYNLKNNISKIKIFDKEGKIIAYEPIKFVYSREKKI